MSDFKLIVSHPTVAIIVHHLHNTFTIIDGTIGKEIS